MKLHANAALSLNGRRRLVGRVVERLRDERPIDVQGAALTSELLSDGAGPLYVESGHSLRYTVRVARLALDPLGAATEVLATAA
jgi:hypothetical protein